jgi:NAD(P)-dependent dehydrogenase (short-subunit alcohol dehydrogenase family)
MRPTVERQSAGGTVRCVKWTAEQIPDQSGRVAVVSGANSGLGLITARELARKGARTVLASRNLAKAEEAKRAILVGAPKAQVDVAELDLAGLDSVRAFAGWLRSEHQGIDLLVNNAGVIAPPRRRTARWLRASVRHQPPRSLRAHRPG